MRYDVIVINKTIIDQNSNQYNQNRNHIRYDLPQHNYNRYQLNTNRFVTAVTIYIKLMSFQSTVKIGEL
jgi:hypothetical protein